MDGKFWASPVYAEGLIYSFSQTGQVIVFKATREFELVAENQLGDEAFPSPAVAGNQLFIRTATRSGGTRQEWLYCFGK